MMPGVGRIGMMIILDIDDTVLNHSWAERGCGNAPIYKSFFADYPEIEWQLIMRLRDIISHHYDIVDHEIIYDIWESGDVVDYLDFC